MIVQLRIFRKQYYTVRRIPQFHDHGVPFEGAAEVVNEDTLQYRVQGSMWRDVPIVYDETEKKKKG